MLYKLYLELIRYVGRPTTITTWVNVTNRFLMRRGRDSNPRGLLRPYLVSSEALSATQPPLRVSYSIVFVLYTKFMILPL